MIMSEKIFDIYIHDLFKSYNVELRDGDYNPEIKNALSSASKRLTGHLGKPDFIAVVKDFVIVIEDKIDKNKLILRENNNVISMSEKAITDYAVNGAVHYAKYIYENSSYKKIFALGNAGDKTHHIFKPVFVGDVIKELPEVNTFWNFASENIEEYYRFYILDQKPSERIKLEKLKSKAEDLHEYLRNYGGLGENEKPLIVSAILLALRENLKLEDLKGDKYKTDGQIIFDKIDTALKRANVSPDVKKERVLDQFKLIVHRPNLNEINNNIDMTPLRYFTKFIRDDIYNPVINNNSPEDYLGRFYGEFIKYSGGDGQSLGVVLTPGHITELFCELVNLKPNDVIFDPCCGTGGFLVAGMYKMLKDAKDNQQKQNIKAHQIFGYEIREDMFSIATTNMILRGDGQSNLKCEDFLKQNTKELQIENKITVGFMNPPYSQAKNAATKDLSELKFIEHLLNSVLPKGRVAIIVPVSTMIGKTKEDKFLKKEILKSHTLEGVISLNKNTFYGIGVVPCIAVFTAGISHDPEKLVKFINFEDDGYEVKKHLGLMPTGREKDRREYLLKCWRGEIKDVTSNFMVETAIDASDEWLHSFYYYNDEIPSEEDFINSVADYLTFEFNMITHGRGYLFGINDDEEDVKKNLVISTE